MQASTDKKKTDSKKKPTSQFVGFRVADQAYAFRIEQIQEIVIPDKITRTPQVPAYCEGVSNLRGSIIPIINLRKLFGLEPKATDGEARTIVVNVIDRAASEPRGERTMGCLVDTVSQVVRIADDDIQPAPETVTADGADYISGFARLGDELVIVLDIDELLDRDQLEQNAPASAGRQEPAV